MSNDLRMTNDKCRMTNCGVASLCILWSPEVGFGYLCGNNNLDIVYRDLILYSPQSRKVRREYLFYVCR